MQKVYFLLLSGSLFLFSMGQESGLKSLVQLCTNVIKKNPLFDPRLKELLKNKEENVHPAIQPVRQDINKFWAKCCFFDEKIICSSWQQIINLNIEKNVQAYKIHSLGNSDYIFLHAYVNNSILIIGPNGKLELPFIAEKINNITFHNKEKLFLTSDFTDSEGKKFIIHNYVDLKIPKIEQKIFSHANDVYNFPITQDKTIRVPSDKSYIEEMYEGKSTRIFTCKRNEKITMIPSSIGSKYIPFVVTNNAQKKSLYFLDLQKPYETQLILNGYKQIVICEHYSSSLLICCTDEGTFHFIDIRNPKRIIEQKLDIPFYIKGKLSSKSSFFYDEEKELLFAQKKPDDYIYVFSKNGDKFDLLTRFKIDKSKVVPGGPIVKIRVENCFRLFSSLKVFKFAMNPRFNENIENALRYYAIKNDSIQFDLFKRVFGNSGRKMKLTSEEKRMIADRWPEKLIEAAEKKVKHLSFNS